ncbi:MAG: UDP-glucuronic acid decarboxylase family protein [Solirubrobacterales bacterium]
MKQKKRVLVAGGAGFLGSHLCERLLNHGNHVLCLDNFATGSMENVSCLLDHKHFQLIRHDVVEPLELRVDEIYNLACPASPVQYQADPIYTLKSSVYGAANLLDLAVHCRARILQASTSEVYGDPQQHPQTETYWGNVNPHGIRACYDEGKRCAETLFFDYHRKHRVQIKVARIFNTYGPHMDLEDGRVVSNFIVQALGQRPLTIYGDGRQTRSLCYVNDLVDGLIAFMNSEPEITGPLNLGNPHEVTMLHLARRILILTESPSRLQFKPLPQDDPVRRKPDIARAQAILGWQPKTSLNVGLRATIAYFRERLEVNRLTPAPRTIPFAEPAVPFKSGVISAVEKLHVSTQYKTPPEEPASLGL